MSAFLSQMAQHGYEIIFLAVFLEAIGLPVPAALALVAGGAATASGILHAPEALLLAVVGMLLGDSLLYVLGRHLGWGLLGYLCKVSANPETCILRSARTQFDLRGGQAIHLSAALSHLRPANWSNSGALPARTCSRTYCYTGRDCAAPMPLA